MTPNRLLRHTAVVNGHAFRSSDAASLSVTDGTDSTDDYASFSDPSSAPSGSSAPSASSVTPYDPSKIDRFLPARPEYWQKCLFRLARHFHGQPDIDKRFAEWRQRVRPAVPDEELVEEWAFAKSEVKHPPRIKLLDVLAQTEAAGIPAWIAAAMPDSGRLQMVLAFLHRLQDESYHKDDNFFISTRDLGSLFGGSRQWAMRALRMFCRRRIIEVVDRGGPHNQKATRFRFVPGRDGGAEW